MYVPTIVPHLALQAPPDLISYYNDKGWDDPAYEGGRGYLPHPTPRAAYAAMVTGMDRNIGRLFAAIKARDEWDNTIVIFTSDNGATFELGGFDPEFFGSNRGLRGHKVQLYEGGLRVPMIVRAPGATRAGSSGDTVVVGYDLHDTILDLVDLPGTGEGDGVSLKPLLVGEDLPTRPDLYWEHHAGGAGKRVLLDQQWKGVRRGTHRAMPNALEIFDIVADPGETTDLAKIVLIWSHVLSLFSPSARWPRFHLGTLTEIVRSRWLSTHHSSWGGGSDGHAATGPRRKHRRARHTRRTQRRLGRRATFGVRHLATPLLVARNGLYGQGGRSIGAFGRNVPLNNAVVHLEMGGQVVFLGFTPETLPRHQLASIRINGTPSTNQDGVRVTSLQRGVMVTRSDSE